MADLRTAIKRFLENTDSRVAASAQSVENKKRIAGHQKNVRAYLENEGFIQHLIENWKRADQVVAIVEGGDGNVRGSLVKRSDAFKFSGFQDTFEADARLIMSADEEGALFQELGPIPEGTA
jgi:hypothetical protein